MPVRHCNSTLQSLKCRQRVPHRSLDDFSFLSSPSSKQQLSFRATSQDAPFEAFAEVIADDSEQFVQDAEELKPEEIQKLLNYRDDGFTPILQQADPPGHRAGEP